MKDFTKKCLGCGSKMVVSGVKNFNGVIVLPKEDEMQCTVCTRIYRYKKRVLVEYRHRFSQPMPIPEGCLLVLNWSRM